MPGGEAAGAQGRGRRFDWEAFGVVAGALTTLVGAAILLGVIDQASTAIGAQASTWAVWAAEHRSTLALGVFCGGAGLSTLTAFVGAARRERLPWTPFGTKREDHIGGLTALAILIGVAAIVGLVGWAAEAEEPKLSEQWGLWVVSGVAGFFLIATIGPKLPAPAPALRWFSRTFGTLTWPLGRLFSYVDSLLALAIAGGAGMGLRNAGLRYGLTIGPIMASAGAFGVLAPAPLGLIPLAWGFLVAIAVTRRWAWVESDRELSMLNRRYVGGHLRVGFANDLRDEALISVAVLILLSPLALMQVHEGFDRKRGGAEQAVFFAAADQSVDAAAPVARTETIVRWVRFYGDELAKAVPFVDWAEIYDVHGSSPFQAVRPAGRHAVFATRVLVDILLLATLLQALGISARNAKQKALFFATNSAGASTREGDRLNRLDPFLERKEFLKLLVRDDQGELVVDPAKVSAFPSYDGARLIEITQPGSGFDKGVVLVARELRKRGVGGAAEFHDRLLELSFDANAPDFDGIDKYVTAIDVAGDFLDVETLGLVRQTLCRHRPARATTSRGGVLRLIVSAPLSADRTNALRDAVIGEFRETRHDNRKLALDGLFTAAKSGDAEALVAIQLVSGNEKETRQTRDYARALLKKLKT